MSSTQSRRGAIAQHYEQDGLLEAVEAALSSCGTAAVRLSLDELGEFDELHVGGRSATAALAEQLAPAGRGPLLDIGCGIGGTARYLAGAHGFQVTGVDLTPSYCRVARYLTSAVGLGQRARFVVGDGVKLPFASGLFAVATSLHAAMNIADKAAFYAEVRRMLAPDGQFALYDLLAGPIAGVRYPVPWADDSESSFLIGPADLTDLLQRVGFQVVERIDRSAGAKASFSDQENPPHRSALARAGVRLLLGKDYRAKMANLRDNLLEDRIAPWMIICRAA